MAKKRLTFIRTMEFGGFPITNKFNYIFKNTRLLNDFLYENKDITIINIEEVE